MTDDTFDHTRAHGPGRNGSEAPGLRVEVCPDPDAVAQRVADVLCGTVEDQPETVLGLATGSTPLPTYREVARRVVGGRVSLGRVRVFILDEYVGLDSGDPRSYRATIRREATGPFGVPDGAVFGPSGEAEDPVAAAAEYEAAIAAAGGIDLQIAGIGRNGHVAFNEPGTALERRTHVATLSETTRADNARFFADGAVPLRAITQGPATIADTRRLVLIATGAGKAPAVAAAVHGPVSSDCPASIVQCHPDAVVVVDRDAGELLHRERGATSRLSPPPASRAKSTGRVWSGWRPGGDVNPLPEPGSEFTAAR